MYLVSPRLTPLEPTRTPRRRVFPCELLISRRKAAEGAAMSNDKQQESLNLAGLASGLTPPHPLSLSRSIALAPIRVLFFFLILVSKCFSCAALSEEDRAGLVNALKVRSWAFFGLC